MTANDVFERRAALPAGDGRDGIVQWRTFRRCDQARRFLPSIRLARGQVLVGGCTQDSLGDLWWLGVRVDDVDGWGNRKALNKHAAGD